MRLRFSLVALAALLTGCPDLPFSAEITAQDGPAATPVTANGQPIPFPRLSEAGGAAFADLIVDREGTLHAVSTEELVAKGGRQVMHRASGDGGKTWSKAVPLTTEGANAGVCRLAIDGKGRVYAVWKDDTEGQDLPSGALYRGTLTYRVFEAGSWSAATRVGTEKQALSWYPAVTPRGEMQLVWNETMPFGQGYTTPAEAGLIKQVALDGPKPGRTFDVYRANAVPVAGTSAYHFDSFEGLNGGVDDSGVPHYVAQKSRAAITEGVPSEPTDIILRLGGPELTFLKVDQFLKGTTHFIDAPTLARDAGGRYHVLILDAKSEPPRFVDYLASDKLSFTTVYRLKEKTGRFMGAQVRQGPQGQWVALMALQDTPDQTAAIDLYAAKFDGHKWLAPVNLTNNAARKATTPSPSPSASPAPTAAGRLNVKYASAAWDAQGKIHIVFVGAAVQKDKDTTAPRADLYFHTF